MEELPKHLKEMEETLQAHRSWLTREYELAKGNGNEGLLKELKGRILSYNRDYARFVDMKKGLT